MPGPDDEPAEHLYGEMPDEFYECYDCKPDGGKTVGGIMEWEGPLSDYHLRTHCPHLPNCPICVQANAKRKQHRRKNEAGDSPKRGTISFGGIVVVDFITPCKKDIEGITNGRECLIFYDLATGWLQVPPPLQNTRPRQ